MTDADKIFMQEALRQAKRAEEEDEVPIGAVIVYEKEIIARAYNQVEKLKDPTAHAEMIAITQATNHLSQKWLHKCTLYVTIEPCSMCAGAFVLARLSRVVFGAADPKAGACGSLWNIANNNQLNHRLEVEGGALADECGFLVTSYFRQKRAIKN